MKCEAIYHSLGCTGVATEIRTNWIWAKEGTSKLVKTNLNFCVHCAQIYDEIQEEGEAEAAMS